MILRTIVDISKPLSSSFEKIKPAFRTELLVKIGLVLLGAEISIGTLWAYGWRGLAQALVVVIAVYYVSLLVAGRLGIDRKFAHMLSTAVSICGVRHTHVPWHAACSESHRHEPGMGGRMVRGALSIPQQLWSGQGLSTGMRR